MLGLTGPMFACSGRNSPASVLSATDEGGGTQSDVGLCFQNVLFFSEMAWRGSASFGPSELTCCL